MDPVGMESLLAKLNAAREALGQTGAAAASPGGAAARAGGAAKAPAVDFGALLQRSLGGVDADQVKAGTMAEQFQLGNPKVTLEETMVAVQKASLSFQQAVQIRNRVIAAYHDVMNMQV
jgi:flagellar hook-basal body complex protein FliE